MALIENSDYANLFIGVTPVTHRCPVCNRTNADVGTMMFGMTITDETPRFCLGCFSDWVKQHVPAMKPVNE